MVSPLTNLALTKLVGASMRFIHDHVNLFMLLVFAVTVLGVALISYHRSPRTRMRLQLGPRRRSNHAQSLPNTPAKRLVELERNEDVDVPSKRSVSHNVPAASAVAEAIATQWNAEDSYTRATYLEFSREGRGHDRECNTSSAGHDPSTPTTVSSFSTVYGVDYGPGAALVVADGVLTTVPNESGSTVRVTELSSLISPVDAEFFELSESDERDQLDEDSLDPELWRALFEGIEPESPGEGTPF